MSAPRRGRGLGWPIGMALILACTVSVNLYVMHLARSDASFAVEPDYYAKAVRWDDELAQRRRNAALGWHVATALERDGADDARVRVRLADSAGRPLTGATVQVEAFAIARSADVRRVPLAAAVERDGEYAARLEDARPGRWELRLEATRGAERFTAVERVELSR